VLDLVVSSFHDELAEVEGDALVLQFLGLAVQPGKQEVVGKVPGSNPATKIQVGASILNES
jgi:hypothetical protein